MASPLRLQHSRKIATTLSYFDPYDYPLTKAEIDHWQSVTVNDQDSYQTKNGYYFLPGRESLIKLRRQREKIAVKKWQIAKKVGMKLKRLPTIAAVLVTGALAMNNTPQADDIDLMVITYPQTLWLTRCLVNLFLHSTRRFPGQKIAPGKICINLWLDTHNLHIKTHNLYQAHEVLQAKVLWDRANIHGDFLQANGWVKKYLPSAYPGSIPDRALASKDWIPFSPLFWPVNLLFFILQYLYMLPKKTSEQVGLGYAFFHPRTEV